MTYQTRYYLNIKKNFLAHSST